MPEDRLLRILTRLSAADAASSGSARLCEVCADVMVMSGAGIMLISSDVSQGSVCTTDDVSALIEELQYTLGEGPCVDAYHRQEPVLEPDLARAVTSRWLAFTPPAVEAGVRAIFGFPLQIGAARIGALNLYRDQPGPLSDDQHADALVLANVAARAVIAVQAGAPPGELAHELAGSGEFRLVVHQASGMISVQLDVSVADALVRLRAYAFANGRALTDVARDVVNRHLRFDDHAPP
jgi:GAF domain-containing protein